VVRPSEGGGVGGGGGGWVPPLGGGNGGGRGYGSVRRAFTVNRPCQRNRHHPLWGGAVRHTFGQFVWSPFRPQGCYRAESLSVSLCYICTCVAANCDHRAIFTSSLSICAIHGTLPTPPLKHPSFFLVSAAPCRVSRQSAQRYLPVLQCEPCHRHLLGAYIKYFQTSQPNQSPTTNIGIRRIRPHYGLGEH